MRLGLAPALLLLLAACAADDAPPEIGTVGAAAGTVALRTLESGPIEVGSASLYAPSRGPVRLADWAALPAPAAPVPGVVYLPSCSTPAAPRDHIPFFQRQGVAVVVPSLGGFGCVEPDMSFERIEVEIERVAEAFGTLPWVDAGRLYLVGHSVGADAATSFDQVGVFQGVIGLAAACTFGVNERIPTLTFRALDDPVLAIRSTRCTMFDSPNALHLEFAGRDHVMRLADGANGSRRLVGRAMAQFIGVADQPAAPTIAEADAMDLQQLSPSIPTATAPPPPAPLEGVVRDVPAFDDGPAPTAPTPATADAEVIFLPSLSLPGGSF